MNNLHFGAGNIGRGFIGQILYQNDFNLHFIDVNQPLLDALNSQKTYTIEEFSEAKTKHLISIQNAWHAESDKDVILEAFKTTDLITTSIGVSGLPKIAFLIALGIENRKTIHTSLNIMACENYVNASDSLKEMVYDHLSKDGQLYANKWVAFVNVAVDRIVPNQSHENLTHVSVEPFYEWVIESSSIKGNLNLEGVLFVDDLSPYIERKLFTVNTGHAACAFKAYQENYEFIDQALSTKSVEGFVLGVLKETSELLIKKYNFDLDVQTAYAKKTIERFKNPYIKDVAVRVARQPIRKLGPSDRIIKPYKECLDLGIQTPYLTQLIVNVLSYDFLEDEEALNLQAMIKRNLKETIKTITELDDTSVEILSNAYLAFHA